jgi:hypothetical protein
MFDFYHRTLAEPPPAHCDLCKAPMFEPQAELPKVNIGGSALSKSVDQTYKLAEQSLGISDMKDSLRAGDSAVKIPVNPVSVTAAQMGHNYWGGGNSALPNAQSIVQGASHLAKDSVAALGTIQTKHRR